MGRIFMAVSAAILLSLGMHAPVPIGVGAEKKQPDGRSVQDAQNRVEELTNQLAAIRRQEAALQKQLARAREDVAMVWEADGRKLEKVIHAIILKPELPSDSPLDWKQALQTVPKPVLVWKLQRVKGKLTWKVERAKDAKILDSGLSKEAPAAWKEALKDLPREVIVWTLDAEAITR